jgi:hypothetical protein
MVPASLAQLAMISPSPNTGPTWPNGRFFLLFADVIEGKVAEVHYDRYGDFAGFMLSDCGKPRTFHSREPGVERLVVLACRERTHIAVEVDPNDRCRFVEISILCP